MTVPQPVRLFHITAMDNLPAICAAGALRCKNTGLAYVNIAHQGAQGARAGKLVPNPPGGSVHDYVPFYFAPRSPMLYAIDRGNVAGCTQRQADIVHFETTVDLALADGANFVIYERNATLPYATPFTSLTGLDKVAWDVILETPRVGDYCKYFHDVPSNPRYADRRERRMAEFLVRGGLSLSRVVRVGVMDQTCAVRARGVLAAAGVPLTVDVKPDWYFLPGQ
jgi:ssDNA thymidine ADP-ribosyltransferase, DarT